MRLRHMESAGFKNVWLKLCTSKASIQFTVSSVLCMFSKGVRCLSELWHVVTSFQQPTWAPGCLYSALSSLGVSCLRLRRWTVSTDSSVTFIIVRSYACLRICYSTLKMCIITRNSNIFFNICFYFLTTLVQFRTTMTNYTYKYVLLVVLLYFFPLNV